MPGSNKKFEASRQRFRARLEEERGKGRRTIFLDQEGPSCSKRPRAAPPPPRQSSRASARCFRMSTSQSAPTIRVQQAPPKPTTTRRGAGTTRTDAQGRAQHANHHTDQQKANIDSNSGPTTNSNDGQQCQDPDRIQQPPPSPVPEAPEIDSTAHSEDNENGAPNIASNPPPTPGCQLPAGPWYCASSNTSEGCSEEEMGWFQPCDPSMTTPPTPGRAYQANPEPRSEGTGSQKPRQKAASVRELSDDGQSETENESPNSDTEASPGTNAKTPSPCASHITISSTEETPPRFRRSWCTVDVQDSRCHTFAGHLGLQRTITYRLWVLNQGPDNGPMIEGACPVQVADESSASSSISWQEVPPATEPTLMQITPERVPWRRLSDSSSPSAVATSPCLSLCASLSWPSPDLSEKSSPLKNCSTPNGDAPNPPEAQRIMVPKRIDTGESPNVIDVDTHPHAAELRSAIDAALATRGRNQRVKWIIQARGQSYRLRITRAGKVHIEEMPEGPR